MQAKIIQVILLIVLSFLQAKAQNNENSIKEISDKEESYILTDVSYISDAVFMGRRDSIAAPYVFPSIGYYDRSGFFADASVSYLTASTEQRVDLVLMSTGYLFDSRKWSGGITATGYFFNEDSYNVLSETSVSINGLVSYDFETFEASLSANSFFNTNATDIFCELKIGRAIYADGNKFLIQPSISVGAGTQNFYEAYYQSSRLGNRKGNNQGGQDQTSPSSITISEATEFNILNIELSAPLQYYHNSFIFSLSPVLALPQSSATITTDDVIIKEDLESVFYWSVGISYWFKTNKKKQQL